jgi:hypothetical protein
MSNTSIQLKKSGATGNTPSGLAFGEVALNYADGKLYYKNSLGGTSYISNQFSFDTINANNSLILATGVSDTLSFVAGNNISISTNTTTKTITIDSSGTATDQFARDAANSAGSYANSGYTQANTATNNAAGASLYANSAFTKANAAFDKANTYPGNANQVLYKNSGNVLTSSSGLVYDGAHLKVNGNLETTYSSGDEGGEIFLSKSVTNTTLVTGVTIDVYQNRFRIFESGGSNRGVYIDMANGATSGIGVNLLSPPGGSVTSVAGATGTVSNTQLIAGIQSVSSSYGITFDYVATANNGQGTNFKVGDDAWIGDYNVANAIKIKGQQDAANGYISFGSNTSRLGVAGAGQLTYGDNTVWHAGNDGAGSGLDADLLDGLNSSAFARDSAESYANSAFLAANTADSKAVTAGSYANSAYTQANTATNNAAGASLYANGAFAQANAAFTRANSVTSGFRANTVIIANSTGFLSNSNAEFSLANNTLYVQNASATNTVFANSITFNDGTKLISANGIVASTAANAVTANVAVNARITNVTTGTYFPIVTDTTITGADTFHYSSNDFLMYAANNTFRATGNLWAGQFITVGSNIPVVNSTGHWVGQPLVANNASTSNVSNVAINARITVVNTGIYYPIVTDTTVTGSDTLHYSSNDFVMFASNNTFRATGNLWAGQFIAVGSNVPVVNSTGHWVGQTLTAIDETARTTGNSAGSYANAAFLKANAAFAAANLATSNVYTFTGTGSCTAFTLSTTTNPSSNSLIVNIDGVIQLHSAYNVSSNVVTFTSAPADSAEIEVQIITGASGSQGALTLTPEVSTTSGSTVDILTNIPSWVKCVTVSFYGISLSGTASPLIQFGTGATPIWTTSGYISSTDNYATTAGPAAGSSIGFRIGSTSSADTVYHGSYIFSLVGSNKWVGQMNGSIGTNTVLFGGGAVALSAALTSIRMTSTNGTDTYDAGSVSVLYE